MARQLSLPLGSRGEGAPWIGEGDEEAVALRVDLDPAVARERFA
jgi:hypothetical protein